VKQLQNSQEIDTMDAKALISKVNTPTMPSPKAVVELRHLFAHNDAQARTGYGRVSAEAACKLLAEHGFVCGRMRLDRVCRDLGRKSYGTP
jgi:hypothetical protein